MAEPINKLSPHIIGGLPYERPLCQTIIYINLLLCLQTLPHHMLNSWAGSEYLQSLPT